MEKLEVLQKFLDDNKDKIPKPTKGVKTLFDIMKQPHLENVWSNIYAFFFNPTEEHGFENLFLRSLVELINEKHNGRDLAMMVDEYIDVKTEDSTDNSKRLDLVLLSDNYSILIENKVYANLNNNLGVYWRNYKSYSNDNKQGVVLSLYPKTILFEGIGKVLGHNPNEWVNITHLELMNRVSKNFHYCLLNSNEKYLNFFKEFYQNIKNITIAMDKEILKFYIENAEEMKRLNYLLTNLKDSVRRQVRGNKTLKGEDLFVNTNNAFDTISEKGHCFGVYFRRAKDKNINCMIAIICKGLFPLDINSDISKNFITVSVEIQRGLSRKVRENFNELGFTKDELKLIEPLAEDNGFYTAVGRKHIPITTVDDMQNISEYIDKALEDKVLLGIYDRIIEFDKNNPSVKK